MDRFFFVQKINYQGEGEAVKFPKNFAIPPLSLLVFA